MYATNAEIASPELGTRKRAWWSKVLSLNWPYYFTLARHPPGLAVGLSPLVAAAVAVQPPPFFLSRGKTLRVLVRHGTPSDGTARAQISRPRRLNVGRAWSKILLKLARLGKPACGSKL